MNQNLSQGLIFLFLLLSSFRMVAQKSKLLSDNFYEQLALRWAPVHMQYVCKKGKDGLNGRGDYITAADFDGDWDMNNNWENLEDTLYPLRAHVYYSIVQTSTHWYINYGFFHPRDWCNVPIRKAFDTHENDLEGELTIVERPAILSDTSFGKFLGMITVFHSGFYAFSNVLSANKKAVKPLEMIEISGEEHPLTVQQSQGHGLKAAPHIKEKKQEWIAYCPSLDKASIPQGHNGEEVSYKLVSIFEKNGLWAHRHDKQTFVSPTGGFYGTYGGKYKAKPPWVWNTRFDDPWLKGGEHATDPVKLAKYYFKMGEDCSEEYEWNGYLSRD